MKFSNSDFVFYSCYFSALQENTRMGGLLQAVSRPHMFEFTFQLKDGLERSKHVVSVSQNDKRLFVVAGAICCIKCCIRFHTLYYCYIVGARILLYGDLDIGWAVENQPLIAAGARWLSLLKRPDWLYKMSYFNGVKRSKRDVLNSPPFSARITDAWSYTVRAIRNKQLTKGTVLLPIHLHHNITPNIPTCFDPRGIMFRKQNQSNAA